ncbi:MAG: hypothetical protein ABIB43_05435 [archaeon]
MVLIALTGGLMAFSGVNNYLDDTTFWKIYYARDIGTIMDVGQTGRGDIELNYNFMEAAKPLTFGLTKPLVELYDRDTELREPLKTTFRYAQDEKIEVKYDTIDATNFKMYFTNKEVIISGEPLKEEVCIEVINMKTPETTEIYVYSDDSEVESLIKIGLRNKQYKVVDELKDDLDLALIILEGKEEDLIFTYNQFLGKSERLSCMIRNKLVEENPDTLFITQLKKIDENSIWKEVIEKADVGMILELGSLDKSDTLPIVEGVIGYYG